MNTTVRFPYIHTSLHIFQAQVLIRYYQHKELRMGEIESSADPVDLDLVLMSKTIPV